MRKSKFSETQIVRILKDAESGVPVADLVPNHGVSMATFFKWRSKYGGATVTDVKRLRELGGCPGRCWNSAAARVRFYATCSTSVASLRPRR